MAHGAEVAEQDAVSNETLPTWNLNDLYPGPDSAELERDLVQMEEAIQAFHKRYCGHLAEQSGDGLAEALETYEQIDETLSRIMSYAGLKHATELNDPETGKFFQSLQERINAATTHLVFFTLELNKLSTEFLDARKAESARLAHYASWLRDLRVFRPYQLADEIERLLHEKYVAGRAAWMRLFDETIAGLKFPIRGKTVGCSDALNNLSSPDPALRRESAESIGKVLGGNIRLFGLITNTLIKDKQIEDGWRGYPHLATARHLSNQVEPEVVQALLDSVKAAYPDLSHRYYRMKAAWFGQTELDYWDRNAPLPDAEDRAISWSEAREMVLQAYSAFSPTMGEIGRRFFDNPWIDAALKDGKSPGAFSHPTVPSVHPYILLNYHGKARDVMTLAHELGHGVHQILAGKQGHLLADTPLTLAETASVFGEMLTFRKLLDSETDPKRRRTLLVAKVEDKLNTVVRQIAFYDFELRLHEERKSGELTAERIGEIWLDVQRESLGPALRFGPGYDTFWAYIPHFIHSPFYVYAYAFGDCLVNSLYALYQEAETGFAERYLEMLQAGGTKRHQELLQPFGLDASDPSFWQKGLGLVRGLLDELSQTEADVRAAGR